MDKTPPKNNKPININAPFKKKKYKVHIDKDMADIHKKNIKLQDNPTNIAK